MENIFTFWEGPMTAYINLCLKTWNFPFTILNYKNIGKYTNLRVDENLKRFSLAKVADVVRAHVLRDQGGYWLDADTIMLTDKLPTANMIGYPEKREHTAGFLYAEKPGIDLFVDWSKYQDEVIRDPYCSNHWSVMANAFTDPYIKEHPEVTICPVRTSWPETYMIDGDGHRYGKYLMFYFDCSYHLDDIEPSDMLMLHNSWTPNWYKSLSASDVLSYDCTLSNFLKELL